jgi:PHP family Zn ribbon phosphoesterase
LNVQDDIIGQEKYLLSFATYISIDDLAEMVKKLKGIMIPAHIDRPSNSIISNLGMIPENLKFTTLEISRHHNVDAYQETYSNYQLIQNSDAHDLGYIGICNRTIELDEKTIDRLIDKLLST